MVAESPDSVNQQRIHHLPCRNRSGGSGSRRFTAMLCKIQQAATIVHTLSGATSECSTWNLSSFTFTFAACYFVCPVEMLLAPGMF